MKRIRSFFKLNSSRVFYLCKYKALDPVRYHVSDKYQLVYIENPKVACTSIKSVIYPNLIDRDMGLHYDADQHSVLDVKQLKDRGYLFFTVVRNPYDRILSCYADKIFARKESGDIFGFKLYRLIYLAFGSSYGRMVSSVSGFIDGAARIPDWLCDRHIKSQACLLEKIEEHELECRVLKFEDIQNEWADMRVKFSVPDLPRKNSRSSGVYTSSEIFSGELSMEDREVIAKRYSDDFVRFGYAK